MEDVAWRIMTVEDKVRFPSKTIARRLKQWQYGDLDGLYNEGKALQMRLLKGSRRKTETEAQQFNKLMNTGKKPIAIANQHI